MASFLKEEIEIDANGGVWWTYYERGVEQEMYLGRSRTPEELEDLAQWAKRRGMVLPPQLASLKLPDFDEEWGWIK